MVIQELIVCLKFYRYHNHGRRCRNRGNSKDSLMLFCEEYQFQIDINTYIRDIEVDLMIGKNHKRI